MNSKILKKFRSAIRSMYPTLPVRRLDQPTRYQMVPDYAAGLNTDGTPKLVPLLFNRPATNAKETQRGAYRLAKKAARADRRPRRA